jgi:solute carrier family 36 (proton-coupled amino acid transporter)
VLLPVILQSKLTNIAYFSIFALISTIISIVLTTISEVRILREPDLAARPLEEEHLYLNPSNLILFMSTFMCIFEGNTSILSLYSETKQPKNFIPINIFSQICLITLFFFSSLLGYLTFGKTLRSVVLLNLPSEDPLTLATQSFYLVTIMGSYVILIQPVYNVIENYKWYKSIKIDAGDHIKFLLVRISIVAFTIWISTCLPNINSVLQITGSASGSLITIILPVLYYNKAYETP